MSRNLKKRVRPQCSGGLDARFEHGLDRVRVHALEQRLELLDRRAEERGLRAKTRSWIDEFVAIPMAEGVESLNLSVSAGILLWELSRTIDG